MVIRMTEHAILVLFIFMQQCYSTLPSNCTNIGGGVRACGGIACVISRVRDQREKM